MNIVNLQGLIGFVKNIGNYLHKKSEMQEDFDSSYTRNNIICEKCSICGSKINYSPPIDKITNLRESRACFHCNASKRNIDLVECVLKIFVMPSSGSLSDSRKRFDDLHIYELASWGPIHQLFSILPHYECSEFFDDVKPGDYHKSAVRCEDVQALTFNDDTFNLIISQDVFEHVPDPLLGFREIYRVLKSGGYHIFTVPLDRNRTKTIKRAINQQGKTGHLLNPMYHDDPIRSEGALVFTDFGFDLIDSLKDIGFEVELYEKHYPKFQGGYNAVFITRKNGNTI